MPRQTKNQYLKTHRRLRHLWLHAPEAFSYLSLREQGQVHDYFQPSRPLTSDSQILIYRADMTGQQPSLPHQAGRALVKLDERTAAYALRKVRPPVAVPAGTRRLRVRAIRRPEPDIQKLTMVVLLLAQQLGEEHQRQTASICRAQPLQTTVALRLLPGAEPAFVYWQIPTTRS